jgi:two-component system, cell cycle response regulator
LESTTFAASGYDIGGLYLFENITDPGVPAMLAQSRVAHFHSGQQIPVLQDGQACVYVVLRGALGNTVIDNAPDDQTRQTRTEKILRGESIGELSVLDDAIHTHTLTALEETDLLIIESYILWQLIDEAEGVARNLLRQLSFRLRAANAQLRSREKVGEFYRQLSMVDGLTGLHNRAWFNDRLSVMIDEAHAMQRSLSLIMIDLDHFKKFNDSHGHLAGDQALRTAAGVLSAALRPSDFAVRYGGEELLVILPDSNQAAARMVAQRLCDRMREAIVFDDMRTQLPHMTASFGVATLTPQQDANALIAVADAALYRAKEAGRNRIAY